MADVVSLPLTDFLWYVDVALDAMVRIVRDLGDDLANRKPDLPGANSPFAVLTHCLGVMEFWGGAMVAERAIERDREAEFRARGRVDDLVDHVAEARHKLEADLAELDPVATPPALLGPEDAGLPFATTKGGVLLHIYEELSQHLGQMELTRDMLVARATR